MRFKHSHPITRNPIAAVLLIGTAAIAASYEPVVTFLVVTFAYVLEHHFIAVVYWRDRERDFTDRYFEASLKGLRITTRTTRHRAEHWNAELERSQELRDFIASEYDSDRAGYTHVFAARKVLTKLGKHTNSTESLEALVRANDELQAIANEITALNQFRPAAKS